ncbi:swr complex subunit [Podila epigama]|nr:swr complex subunit [Podila epigama]
MATGSDVREIFHLAKPSEQTVRVRKAEKKPDGISRELYGLIGNNVSTVAFNNPTYKPKLNRNTKAVSWTWRPFVNPSREDDLVLYHWQKTKSDPNEEYPFHKFNKAIELQEFTREEYNAHLKARDWTYEETEYLWDLCRRFDLRWVVIQDRYEWPPQEQDLLALKYHAQTVLESKNPEPSSATSAATSSGVTADSTLYPTSTQSFTQSTSVSSQPAEATAMPLHSPASTAASSSSTSTSTPAAPTTADTLANTPNNAMVTFQPTKTRTMEELKDRYYSVTRTMIKVRMTDSSQAVEKAQLLSSMAYDKNRESERKKNLEILNLRTQEQIEEEEALYMEAKRIEQNEKKITKERENLLRLLSTRDIYGPGGPASAGLASAGSLSAGGGGPGTGIIIPSNSITIPASTSTNGPASPLTKNTAKETAAAVQTPTPKKKKKAPKGSTQADDAAASASSSTTAAASSSASSAAASTSAAAPSSSSQKGSSNRRASNSSITDSTSIVQNLPQGVQIKKGGLTAGAYIRSQKMAPVASTKLQRVQAALVQLGIPLKPSMPTATVMAKWDELNNNIVALLDLKRQVDKQEAELKLVKLRRGSASSATGPSTSGAGTASLGTPATSTPGSSSSQLADSGFGIKREGTADEVGTPGQVKKKKRKE